MSILDYIEKIKRENEGPRITAQEPRNMELAKAEIPRHLWTNMNTPDLEQTEVLRPGETLEDWDVSFRRPNADGGVQQLVAPSVDGSRPGYNGLPRFVTKDPRSKSKPYRVKVKASKKLGRDKFEGKFSTLKEAKAKAAEFSGGKPGLAADPSIPKQTQKIVDRYNSLIEKGLEKKNLSNIDFFETWLKKNYPDNYETIKRRVYTPKYNIKYIDITKAKEQLAETLVDDSFKIERMVKYQDIYDKLGFSRSAEASPTIRNIVDKGLKNQLPKKVNLAFNNIIKEDAFIDGTLTNTIAKRIGMVPTGATRWREYLTNNPNWKKNKKIMEYTFSSNARIPGTTFSEMFDEGKYRIGGGVKWSGKQTQTAGVRKNIMDYALTHWHRNNYDKGTSLIEFFDSKGSPIKWKPGLKLNISNVQFKIPSESDKMWSFNGKPKGSFSVSGQDARTSGIFDEVTATYKTQQDLAGSKVTHPVTGKEVKFAELMDEVYRTGYGWTGKSTITGADIDHFKGVKNHPFKNLRVMDKRMNIALGAIDRWIPNRNLKVRLKNELLGKLSTTTGSNYEKALKKNFLKQADDVLVKGIIPEKKLWATTIEAVAKQKDLPQTQKKIVQNILSGWCSKGTQRVKDGGRIGFSGDCPDSEKITNMKNAAEKLKQHDRYLRGYTNKTPFASEAEAKALASKMAKSGGLLRRAGRLAMGPMTLWGEPLFEAAFVAHDILGTGTPWKEGVAKSLWAKPAIAMGLLKPADQQYEEALWQVRDEEGKALLKEDQTMAAPGAPMELRTRTGVKRFIDNNKKIDELNRLFALKQGVRGAGRLSSDQVAAEKAARDKNYKDYLESLGGAEGVTKIKAQIENDREAYDDQVARLEIERAQDSLYGGVISGVKADQLQREKMKDLMYQKHGKKMKGGEWIIDPKLKDAFFPQEVLDPNFNMRAILDLPTEASWSPNYPKTYADFYPTPSSRYGWDQTGPIAQAGGISKLADGGRAGYMGGGIAGIRRPHAIPPERQGLRSIMINVNDD